MSSEVLAFIFELDLQEHKVINERENNIKTNNIVQNN